MNIFKAIRNWFSRKRSAEDLLRGVIYAGFWSNDGVCHYCGRFSPAYNEHHAGCLVDELIAWAKDHGIDPDADEERFLVDLTAEPRTAWESPAERPLTAEEIAEAKKRAEGVRESMVALKTTWNNHIVEPAQISDEERAKIATQYAPHDYGDTFHCRRCGKAQKEYYQGSQAANCEINPPEPPTTDGG